MCIKINLWFELQLSDLLARKISQQFRTEYTESVYFFNS